MVKINNFNAMHFSSLSNFCDGSLRLNIYFSLFVSWNACNAILFLFFKRSLSFVELRSFHKNSQKIDNKVVCFLT